MRASERSSMQNASTANIRKSASVKAAPRRASLLLRLDTDGRVPSPQHLALRGFRNLNDRSCWSGMACSIRNPSSDLELPDSGDPITRQHLQRDAFGYGV